MKKSYIKPEVQVISYTLNEAIANSCGAQLYNHSSDTSCKLKDPFNDLYNFGKFDFLENCDTPLDGYCYVTATQIFAS